MKKLSFLDKAFLTTETRDTPMHVGGLSLFTLPDGGDETAFVHGLAEVLRSTEEYQSPYGEHLKTGPLGLVGPAHWVPDRAIDIDYHIRHSSLPKPGRYRELFGLISRLHGTLMDRSRPLWELHLIEGLENHQIALYTKTHHAVVDGVRGIHLAQSMFTDSPDARIEYSPLSAQAGKVYRDSMKKQHPGASTDAELRNVADRLKERFDSGVNIFGALKRVSETWMGRGGSLMLPFYNVPRSSFNTPVDGARRFVAQSWPFDRIRAIGKELDGTFNDSILAMCAGALRIYMQKHAELPEKSLKAMVPVSLRREGDLDSSNAVRSISADLATNIKDPIKRFAAIRASTIAGKAFYKDMLPEEAQLFSTVLQLPGLLLMPLGLVSQLPPFNVAISNVPGPRKTMYWNGARLDGMYPASIVTEGMALNITMITYGKNVDFGFMSCRRTMPQAQRLIDYMEESLVELEEAVGSRKPKAKRANNKPKNV
jgi:diacylglycerol O-acyltransferase